MCTATYIFLCSWVMHDIINIIIAKNLVQAQLAAQLLGSS